MRISPENVITSIEISRDIVWGEIIQTNCTFVQQTITLRKIRHLVYRVHVERKACNISNQRFNLFLFRLDQALFCKEKRKE